MCHPAHQPCIQVTATRILYGQQQGKSDPDGSGGGGGEEAQLVWEREFPHTGLVKTYNVDAQVPDSAGTASALFTGVKTRMGVLGIDATPVRGDCRGALEYPVPNVAEWVKAKGMGLGLVTTAAVTDATPGGVYAHSADRTWQAQAPAPCVDIATQLMQLNTTAGAPFDVVLGGGRANFVPSGRPDGADLVQVWVNGSGDTAAYATTTVELADIDASTAWPVLGLFANGSMDWNADRDTAPDGQPSLDNMTRFAIEALATRYRTQGYFLLVEAARIDHGHHATDAYRALTDAVELNDAVTAALELVNLDETLILVTSDHGHTTTMGGYAVRGNPMLGKVRVHNATTHLPEAKPALASDGLECKWM